MATNIANNIKDIIRREGLKQKSVAKKSNISEKKFSDMLNGKAVIKAEYIPPIAKALDVTPDELFGFGNAISDQ